MSFRFVLLVLLYFYDRNAAGKYIKINFSEEYFT